MPDWTHTLDLRQGGFRSGFLANNIPLEDQDLAEGGALVDQADAVPDLEDMTKAQLLAEAQRLDVTTVAGATKADIVAAIRGE